MTHPRYPELAAEIGHRGDTTGGPPPPGIKAAPGTRQGGAVSPAPGLLAARPDLAGDLARRGDLSGQGTGHPPADPYGTRRGRDLKASWEWLRFMASLPADPVPVPVSSTGGLIETGRQILFGGSFNNLATVAVTVMIRDGMDATGGFVTAVSVPGGGVASLQLPLAGVILEIGAFAVYSAAGITGAVWLGHLWKYPFTPPAE